MIDNKFVNSMPQPICFAICRRYLTNKLHQAILPSDWRRIANYGNMCDCTSTKFNTMNLTGVVVWLIANFSPTMVILYTHLYTSSHSLYLWYRTLSSSTQRSLQYNTHRLKAQILPSSNRSLIILTYLTLYHSCVMSTILSLSLALCYFLCVFACENND